jgi:hypothetical protein
MVNYKLDGKKIVPCESLLEWATAFESMDRHVADEKVLGLRVSTVFLGADHNFGFNNESEPVLFETMVFVGRTGHDIEMRRYCTWDEAEAGHKEIVANIKRHPWDNVIVPWAEYIKHRLRSKVFDLLFKVLVWAWPIVFKLKLAAHKMTDKIKAWWQ